MSGCWGKKLEFEYSSDTITHSGYTAWSSYYSSFTMNNSYSKIKLKINALNRTDGIYIGISPSTKYINCPFYYNENSLSFCSDGKQFVNANMINKANTGYKTDDIIILSITHNEIIWELNNDIKWSQYIQPNIKYKLAISIWKRYDSITILEVDMTETHCAILQRQAFKQRSIMRQIGLHRSMEVGQNWYPINEKWFKSWKKFAHFDTNDEIKATDMLCDLHPGPIDNCKLVAPITDYENMFNINFKDINKRDYAVIDLVFGYIRQQQKFLDCNTTLFVISDIIKYCCLSYHGLMSIKQKINMHDDYILIHKDVWNYLYLWYGGGPVFKRKTYLIEAGVGIRNFHLFVSLYPKWMNISYCDDNTGKIDLNKFEIKEFPSKFSLRAVAKLMEDELDIEKHWQSQCIRVWLKFRHIKHIYTVNKNVKVTMNDLKDENPDRFVEVPDDYLHSITLNELELNDNESIVIEKKQDNNGWPRADHYNYTENWKYNVKIGDIIDVKDLHDKWYEAVIRYIYPKTHENKNKIIIHYIGWRITWDEMVDINDEEHIAKRHIHTKGPPRSKHIWYYSQ
eukprot:541590_1